MAATRLLELQAVSKSFGGLTCIDELDLHVDEYEILSVIGPNGAGKTTLFNLVTGVYAPDAGDIRFAGESLLGLEPHDITKRGIARTFQTLRLFLNMSVRENVMAAAYGHTTAGPFRSMVRTRRMRREEQEIRQLAEERLAFFGERLMGYRWDQPAYSLSYANRRRLEIARATATNPRLLLLDEPAAGMNPKETQEITELIGKHPKPDNVIVGVRPEHLADAALIDGYQRISALTFEVNVDMVESLGADKYVYFTTEGCVVYSDQLPELDEKSGGKEHEFVARVLAASKAAKGKSLELAFDTSKLAVFDADTGVNLTVPPPPETE